ncbi:hypothetical protein, partial [Enterobacter hormaechei]|uniref:hypothetical protein n=1 Tax=Enterobacter hormaechei TaxID=158836 RepID=UPI0029D8B029
MFSSKIPLKSFNPVQEWWKNEEGTRIGYLNTAQLVLLRERDHYLAFTNQKITDQFNSSSTNVTPPRERDAQTPQAFA